MVEGIRSCKNIMVDKEKSKRKCLYGINDTDYKKRQECPYIM